MGKLSTQQLVWFEINVPNDVFSPVHYDVPMESSADNAIYFPHDAFAHVGSR